jgi:hypothetical protein
MLDGDGLEPGPIVLEDMPFGPRVSHEGLFEGHVDQLLGTLAGSDGPLQVLAHHAGDDVPTDIDASFAQTVGSAEEAHADQVHAGPQSIADSLTDSGEDVATLRASVLKYLPAPTAPIAASFDPPPDAGIIKTGYGFENPPPDTSGGVDTQTTGGY